MSIKKCRFSWARSNLKQHTVSLYSLQEQPLYFPSQIFQPGGLCYLKLKCCGSVSCLSCPDGSDKYLYSYLLAVRESYWHCKYKFLISMSLQYISLQGKQYLVGSDLDRAPRAFNSDQDVENRGDPGIRICLRWRIRVQEIKRIFNPSIFHFTLMGIFLTRRTLTWKLNEYIFSCDGNNEIQNWKVGSALDYLQ